jgi:hypothetical protein
MRAGVIPRQLDGTDGVIDRRVPFSARPHRLVGGRRE